jgi:Uma2 family endonuclease
MTTVSNPMTADELFALPGSSGPCELVRGERRMMTPAGYDHGRIENSLNYVLTHFVKQRSLGGVLTSDTGFLLTRNPDTVRCADVAFIRRERINPPDRQGPYYPGAPDLAIEIVSPTDRAGEIDEKVRDWLDHGCQVVWLVNPTWRTVTVYRSGADIKVFTETDALDEPSLLAGFSLPVREIFDVPS